MYLSGATGTKLADTTSLLITSAPRVAVLGASNVGVERHHLVNSRRILSNAPQPMCLCIGVAVISESPLLLPQTSRPTTAKSSVIPSCLVLGPCVPALALQCLPDKYSAGHRPVYTKLPHFTAGSKWLRPGWVVIVRSAMLFLRQCCRSAKFSLPRENPSLVHWPYPLHVGQQTLRDPSSCANVPGLGT